MIHKVAGKHDRVRCDVTVASAGNSDTLGESLDFLPISADFATSFQTSFDDPLYLIKRHFEESDSDISFLSWIRDVHEINTRHRILPNTE